MPRALYIDDTVDTCDCCGRTNLKKTVAMMLDDGSIVHYGSVCAGRNTGKTAATIKREVIAERNLNIGRARNEYRDSWEYRYLREERLFWRDRKGPMTDSQTENMQRLEDAAKARMAELAQKYGVTVSEIRHG